MFHKIFRPAVVVVCSLCTAHVMAGGPPWLCLPIDGVTAANAQECAARLTAVVGQTPHRDGVKMLRVGKQWYARVFIGEDVTLREIEKAFEDSDFSLPFDRFHLFGHVVLEIDAGQARPAELMAVLEAIEYVSVAKYERNDGTLLVTVDMPYPLATDSRDLESVAWETFVRNDFASDRSTRSENPAAAHELPSYADFHSAIEKHDARLADVRWSPSYGCRPLGCVAAVESDGQFAKTAGGQ